MYYKQSDAMQVTSSVCTLLLQYVKSAAASASAQSINEHPRSMVTWTCHYGKKTNGKSFLTSLIGRDGVLSGWYGRSMVTGCFHNICQPSHMKCTIKVLLQSMHTEHGHI